MWFRLRRPSTDLVLLVLLLFSVAAEHAMIGEDSASHALGRLLFWARHWLAILAQLTSGL